MIPDEELEELVADLAHDLGRRIAAPVTFLPPGASSEDVRRGLDDAISRTRHGGGEITSAAELWRAFDAEARPDCGSLPSYGSLESALFRAIAWKAAPDPLDRSLLERDLEAVSIAIRALASELAHRKAR